MDGVDELVLVGLSQRTAPVDVRERYAVAPEDAPGLLVQLASTDTFDEAFVLSTCNRTEVLVACPDGDVGANALRSSVFRNLDVAHGYTFRGLHAVMHLFRVASGLDSLVVGESEILGQIKRGLEVADERGTLGSYLRPLLTQALVVGKRARTETSIGEGSLSIARVGIEVAARALGRFEGRSAVVVGAGETGLLAARHLTAQRVARIALLNRTLERATDAAKELGGHVAPGGLEALASELVRADIAVVCVDGSRPLVTTESFDRRALARRDQPLIILDLSVPRGVETAVGEMDGLIVYDLDALLPIVEENRAGRDAAAEEVTAILVAEVHKYLSLRTFANFSPAIEGLKVRFSGAREELIDRVTRGQATARELELAHALEKHLLGLALGQMKESARHSRSEAALDREYRRFLDELSRGS